MEFVNFRAKSPNNRAYAHVPKFYYFYEIMLESTIKISLIKYRITPL